MSTWKEITKEEFEGKVKTSAEYEAEIDLLKKNHTLEVEGLRADILSKDLEIGRLMHKINVKK
tara:strand:+ start:109 stop:297 length:189 start_codon:yes stop_codon:yes gene_type:complete